MTFLLAQGAASAFASWIILAIVAAGIIGIALIAIRAAGLDIPPWVIQILWIVLVVLVAVVAIRFLLSAI